MEAIFQLTKNELTAALNQVLDERELQRVKKENLKSLTIHQVAKRLGRAHATIKKYVDSELLKTTKDGRIPEVELEKFLESE